MSLGKKQYEALDDKHKKILEKLSLSSCSDCNDANTLTPSFLGIAEPIDVHDTSVSSISPQIAINNANNAIAVWSHSDGKILNVWANLFNGTAWSQPEVIGANDSGFAYDPQIDINDNGFAVAVWRQYDDTRTNIRANRFNGAVWTGPELIGKNDMGGAAFPQIAIDGKGDAIAVWSQSEGTASRIWANRLKNSEWSGARPISTNHSRKTWEPQIAMNKNGNAMVVWLQHDPKGYNVWGNRFSGTSWLGAELIHSDDSQQSHVPQVAIDANGKAFVVWYQTDVKTIKSSLWFSLFDGDTWKKPKEIRSINSNGIYEYKVVCDAEGKALVIWCENGKMGRQIWFNHFDGNSWQGAQTIIETKAAGEMFEPQIASDSDGSSTAVWYQENNGKSDAWVCRFNGTAWSKPELIQPNYFGNVFEPQIAMNDRGLAIAVWSQSHSILDDSIRRIWAIQPTTSEQRMAP